MFKKIRIVAALVALLSATGCERWTLDRKMEELCKKDAGLKVYEIVTLPASEFNNVGEPLAKYAQQAKSFEDQLGPDYRYVVRKEVVAGRPDADPDRGQGQLVRVYEGVVRRADNKLLGEYVWYSRGGGDFFTFGFQPSGNYCPKPGTSVINAVFTKGF